MFLDIFGGLLGIAGAIINLVDYGFQLSAASEDIRVSGILITAISQTADYVRSSRERLAAHIDPAQAARIESALQQTGFILNLVEKAVCRNGPGPDGRQRVTQKLVWVFRDKGRVVTHQTVLQLLHATLLGISSELAMLSYTEIYSNDPQAAIIASLQSWTMQQKTEEEKGDGSESCLIESKVTIAADLERVFMERIQGRTEDLYSLQSKLAISEILKKMYVSKTAEDTERYSSQSQYCIAADITKRYLGRAGDDSLWQGNP
jgi:hypothetical protein